MATIARQCKAKTKSGGERRTRPRGKKGARPNGLTFAQMIAAAIGNEAAKGNVRAAREIRRATEDAPPNILDASDILPVAEMIAFDSTRA
ncbi:MAG: hypothetical protein FJ009_02910 [Chloroflexi bacterium]|nr:hypothetical protein [Chloroflexota bacterium]